MNGEKIVDILIQRIGKPFKLAFLPYNYRMWDSMESVYHNAVKKGIESIVVPVPYYVLNTKNRGIDFVKYEGDYPDNVKVYSYENFKDLQDVEYCVIHNPYDDHNILTQVIPEFNSGNLKKQGKKIIYIPYYITGNWHTSVHCIDQPGVHNADFIFLNSQVEYEDFVKVLKKGSHIFVTGSPKVDALKKYTAVENNNHILVASSLVPYMSRPSHKLQVYREIIEKCLKDGKSVIYREHPLMQIGVRETCTELGHKQYQDFLCWVRDVAVLDDNELGYTISRCNYMYTDPSSIVAVWQQTKKPYEIMN